MRAVPPSWSREAGDWPRLTILISLPCDLEANHDGHADQVGVSDDQNKHERGLSVSRGSFFGSCPQKNNESTLVGGMKAFIKAVVAH